MLQEVELLDYFVVDLQAANIGPFGKTHCPIWDEADNGNVV